MSKTDRRTFLEFIGKGIAGSVLLPPLMVGCGTTKKATDQTLGKVMKDIKYRINRVAPTEIDDLVLAEGLQYEILIKWGDAISDTDTFGFNNDYTAFIPFDPKDPSDGILWVNHEYIDPLFVSGYNSKDENAERTKEQVDKEMYEVGGSLIRVRKDKKGKWEVVEGDEHNRRLNGFTKIPFNWPYRIRGGRKAMGTMANCSGGITPWGTILTCEENYDSFYGERNLEDDSLTISPYDVGWHQFYENPPEHYGWVVEVNPLTGEAKKHVALGRCAHECATMYELPDKRLVVYTGDDANDECLYKYISKEPGSLTEGTLYVANTETGKWVSLNIDEQPILKENFKSQTEVLIYLRKAAKLVGGTPLARPEDIEIDPMTGNILISLTNNKPKGDYYGSILKIEETDGKYDSLTFQSDVYLAGGPETGFACPDNMAFDTAGNLWFTSDISGGDMKKPEYADAGFKNNGLYVVPRSGPQAGKVIQVASAPTESEFTGPFFSPDGKTLFLSVQHPGEYSQDLDNLTSHWPEGGTSIPKSSVVTISGELLNELQNV